MGSGSLYYLRPLSAPGDRTLMEQREGGGNVSPMIIDSVPVVHGNSSGGRITDTTAKKLRLFGVNMECSSSSNTVGHVPMDDTSLASQNLQYLTEFQEEEDPISSSSSSASRFADQKGKTSMLFDLSPSFQCRQ